MPASGAGLRAGIGCFGRALRLLRSHSELWVACALPLLLNLGVFGVATLVFLSQLDGVAAALRDALATAEPRVWYEWIWIGPLRALAVALRGLLIGLFALAVYFLFTLVGGVLASPLLDRLSERVEALQAQGLSSPPRGSLASSLRALREEAKRAGFFLVLQAALWLLAWIPGLAPLAWLAALLLCVLFLPLDYTGYVLDRRELPFRVRRAWLWRQRRAMLGFGVVALGTFAVPGLNFLCLPWLVTAGTLLALEIGPPELPVLATSREGSEAGAASGLAEGPSARDPRSGGG